MKVLAFDLATHCGVAVCAGGESPRAWSVDLSLAKTLTEGQRWARALRMAERYADEHKPDFVAIEAPIGGKNTSMFLVGLAACVEAQVSRMGYPCTAYNIGAIRKHFLGKALTARDFPGLSHAAAKKAIKAAVMGRCRLLGWTVEDDDAADAAALADYALAMHRVQVAPGGGLFL